MKNLMKRVAFAAALAALFLVPIGAGAHELPRLTVSQNGHYLQLEDGRPFFFQGDTAWELFHRLDREEVDLYLQDRAAKGYNVIQAVALAELDGIDVPNAYGYKPLVDRNPAKPAVVEGSDNDYWDHVDYVIAKANSLGLYVGLLPTWGRYWHDGVSVFDAENAEAYGRWIAGRYRDCDVIWMLGGDRNPNNDAMASVIDAMAEGISAADGYNLMTYHPAGGYSSSQWYHAAGWLDFNGRQSSHSPRYESNSKIYDDFRRTPCKPVVEIEPLYEDHPLEFRPDDYGHSNAWDVRHTMYWSVFYGSAGVTYGHHSVWQMYDSQKGHAPVNRPLMSWREALGQPAAGQVVYLRRLMESRPYFDRVPAPELIIPDKVQSAVPGSGRYRFVATMGADGSYAMVYAPHSVPFSIDGSLLPARKLVVWWYSPRTGKARRTGRIDNDGSPLRFCPPMKGEALDWVLVIDDASRHYPAPGSAPRSRNR